MIEIKKILSTKQIPKKDGSGSFPVSQVLTVDDEVGEEALFSDDVHVQKRRQTPEVDDEYEIPPFLRSDNY